MGIAVQLIVAAIGLTSLLNVVAGAFEWLRWAGAAYLVYLGIKQWRSASKPLEFDTSAVSKKNVFVQGLITTIFNPKSLIFIAAFLPQFIDVARPPGLQFIFLQSQRAFQSVSRVAGGLMIIAGVGLALARRNN
jgi:homoserine/homoserine lactone efflux protein